MGWPRPRQVISKVNKDKYAAGLDKQHLRAALSEGPAEIQVMGGFRGRAEEAAPPPLFVGFILKTIVTNQHSSGTHVLCNQACVDGMGQGCAVAEIFSAPSF